MEGAKFSSSVKLHCFAPQKVIENRCLHTAAQFSFGNFSYVFRCYQRGCPQINLFHRVCFNHILTINCIGLFESGDVIELEHIVVNTGSSVVATDFEHIVGSASRIILQRDCGNPSGLACRINAGRTVGVSLTNPLE